MLLYFYTSISVLQDKHFKQKISVGEKVSL